MQKRCKNDAKYRSKNDAKTLQNDAKTMQNDVKNDAKINARFWIN